MSNISYYLRPPATINLCVDHAPDVYANPPKVMIDSISRVEIGDIELPLSNLMVSIASCQVEIIEGQTDGGQIFRAFRIIGLSGLTAEEYDCNDYPVFLKSHNYVRGTLSVDDGHAYYRYIVDRWYGDDILRIADDSYADPPDVIPALALEFMPSVREQGVVNNGCYRSFLPGCSCLKDCT